MATVPLYLTRQPTGSIIRIYEVFMDEKTLTKYLMIVGIEIVIEGCSLIFNGKLPRTLGKKREMLSGYLPNRLTTGNLLFCTGMFYSKFGKKKHFKALPGRFDILSKIKFTLDIIPEEQRMPFYNLEKMATLPSNAKKATILGLKSMIQSLKLLVKFKIQKPSMQISCESFDYSKPAFSTPTSQRATEDEVQNAGNNESNGMSSIGSQNASKASFQIENTSSHASSLVPADAKDISEVRRGSDFKYLETFDNLTNQSYGLNLQTPCSYPLSNIHLSSDEVNLPREKKFSIHPSIVEEPDFHPNSSRSNEESLSTIISEYKKLI
jgi:hypothetical protein